MPENTRITRRSSLRLMESSSQPLKGLSNGPKTRKRAALGDISNQASAKKKVASNKKSGVSTRSSARLAKRVTPNKTPTKRTTAIRRSPRLAVKDPDILPSPKTPKPTCRLDPSVPLFVQPYAVYSSEINDIKDKTVEQFEHCAELAPFLDSYYYENEIKYRPLPYLDSPIPGNQRREIKAIMRTVLVDWFVEVAIEYEMSQLSLYLAVNIVDRALPKLRVSRGTLQLVGCACMLIACKYHEVNSPTADDFCYVSDNTYSREEILDMEEQVLEVIEYRLGATTAFNFMPRYKVLGELAEKQYHLACYLLELAMLHHSLLHYRPSIMAAAAVALARMTTDMLPWSITLQWYTRYRLDDFAECLNEIHALHTEEFDNMQFNRSKVKAVTEKYGRRHYLRVTNLEPADDDDMETFVL